MPGWLKVVLSIVAIGFLFVAIAVFIGYRWVQRNKGQLVAAGKEMRTQGASFGNGKDGNQCIDESLRRLQSADGIMEQVKLRLFLGGCLETAAQSPTFCEAVPQQNEIITAAEWTVQQCRARGFSKDPGPCTRVLQEVIDHCEKTRRTPVDNRRTSG